MKNCICKNKRIATFTLIELLVVIAIIMLLAAVLMPALSKAKARVKVISCCSNLKQNAILHFNYVNDYNEYLPSNNNPETTIYYNWYQYFILAEYITKYTVFACPVGPTKAWSAGNPPWCGFLYGAELRWNPIKISKINKPANPSYYPLLGDSSNTSYTEASSVPYCQFWNFGYTTSGGCIFLRHNNYANILFGDGHAESVDKNKMRGSLHTWNNGSNCWLVVGRGDF